MKAERRHELQTNELAGLVAQWLEKSRGHWGTIGWLAAAAFAVVALVSLWNARQGGTQAEAWQKYEDALRVDSSLVPTRLAQIAKNYPDTEVGLWAQLDLADHRASEGREKLDKERGIGVTRLREAQAAYAAVLASPRVLPDMIRRAAIAEAKCFELIGDREKAIEAYRAVAKKYRDILPAVAHDAERLTTELESQEAADFYKWLADYKPPASSGAAADLAFPPESNDDTPNGDQSAPGDLFDRRRAMPIEKDDSAAEKPKSSEPEAGPADPLAAKKDSSDASEPDATAPATPAKSGGAPTTKSEKASSDPSPPNSDGKPPELPEQNN